MRFGRFNRSAEKENFDDSLVDEVFENEENLSSHQDTDMLTLEGLRRTYNSCSNCGVSWYDDHVSLDCSECGGYSLSRPCPSCNGECGNKWKRDVKASRVKKQAQWHGMCLLNPDQSLADQSTKNSNFQRSSAINQNGAQHHHQHHILSSTN